MKVWKCNCCRTPQTFKPDFYIFHPFSVRIQSFGWGNSGCVVNNLQIHVGSYCRGQLGQKRETTKKEGEIGSEKKKHGKMKGKTMNKMF